MSMDELNRFSNFGTKALTGEGSYGQVSFAKFSDGQSAAIKKLDTSSSPEPDSDFTAQMNEALEIFIFTYFGKTNEHFMGLLGYCLEANNRILAYEYAITRRRKGVQRAEPGPVLTWNRRVKVAYGAAKGLEYLHENFQPSIVHRDVRSSNVLLFDDFLPKIALTNQSSDTAALLRSTRALGTFINHASKYTMTSQIKKRRLQL
ncbi:unnamed protein product [Fraxinus pennsylvanica]|uniref:Protein kinase domain-containing protein n=1 Tax=Fraxinus pennsylvanica TaxID=56036 RepID=A0AAD2E978_9LAMI|nr:unnamed protein product [Fraxinus pennsylvanica]